MTITHSNTISSVQPVSRLERAGEGGALGNTKPYYSVEQAAEQIARSGKTWKDHNDDDKIDLTYSFLSAPNTAFEKLGLAGFSEFNPAQKSQAALAMQSWADVANISFTEAQAGGDGHLSFGNQGLEEEGLAFASLPDTNPDYDGQSWYLVNDTHDQNKAPALNNYGRFTLVHEMGHILGLSHPSDYDDGAHGPSYADADYVQDTRGYSVMSYWSESHTGQDFSRDGTNAYASAPLMDDIAAIQKLYGANYSTRSGDTTYGFNSNTDRDYLTATSSSDMLVFSVWDGGGSDTLDFSGFSQKQKIDLHTGVFSDVGGLVGNVSIAQGVTIENAIGGSGNDRLIGNEVANELHGGAGNDILDGAGGADKLWGGAGKDTFVFGAVSDSAPHAADLILDFVSGQDRLDLTAMTKGEGLKFVTSFTGKADQAILSYFPRFDESSLEVDFNGDGVADFRVLAVGQVTMTDIVA